MAFCNFTTKPWNKYPVWDFLCFLNLRIVAFHHSKAFLFIIFLSFALISICSLPFFWKFYKGLYRILYNVIYNLFMLYNVLLTSFIFFISLSYSFSPCGANGFSTMPGTWQTLSVRGSLAPSRHTWGSKAQRGVITRA